MSRLKNNQVLAWLGIVLSAFLSSFAIKEFVSPANLVSAGITGVVILLQQEFTNLFNLHLSFGFLYFLINALILLFVYKNLGKRFVMYSITHVILTSVFVEIIPSFAMTRDILLLSI